MLAQSLTPAPPGRRASPTGDWWGSQYRCRGSFIHKPNPGNLRKAVQEETGAESQSEGVMARPTKRGRQRNCEKEENANRERWRAQEKLAKRRVCGTRTDARIARREANGNEQ